MNTLKMQFILQTNYDKLQHLIDKHLHTIQKCMRPLVTEILEADPDPNDAAEFNKLFRKISIYIILASGLGNPSYIIVSIVFFCSVAQSNLLAIAHVVVERLSNKQCLFRLPP